MDMSFSPGDWPQMRSESRKGADSVGPEWRALLIRLDAAQSARVSLNDAGQPTRQGSFSPVSARNIEALGNGASEDDRAVNQGVSGNRNGAVPEGCEEAGTELSGYARD